VYVEERKFAWYIPSLWIFDAHNMVFSESCIKGHRSSSCHHSDRPLFEIKRKGRPVSQCDKCRELRQLKRVHTKCLCTPKSDLSTARVPIPSNGTKCELALLSLFFLATHNHLAFAAKRYMPVVPALPNGIKDLVQGPNSGSPKRGTLSIIERCPCHTVADLTLQDFY
jgi:hypothetical protein